MRGGARTGAGRKPGQKTAKNREVAEALKADGGLTPLEYMLQVMRDQKADPKRRDEMAKGAAPYMHPRLAQVEHSGKDGGPITVQLHPLDSLPTA